MNIKSEHRQWFVAIRNPGLWSTFDSQGPEAATEDGPMNCAGAMFAIEVGGENAIQPATESVSNQIETHQPTQDVE